MKIFWIKKYLKKLCSFSSLSEFVMFCNKAVFFLITLWYLNHEFLFKSLPINRYMVIICLSIEAIHIVYVEFYKNRIIKKWDEILNDPNNHEEFNKKNIIKETLKIKEKIINKSLMKKGYNKKIL